jgi:hypothetical protein
VRWRDSADDAKARNSAMPPGAEPEPFAEGVAFRPDDGTRWGRWRVARQSMDGPSKWDVWDMRRCGDAVAPRQAVRVVAGLPTPQAAIVVAEVLAASRLARVGVAAVRAATLAVLAVREEWRLR